MKQKIVMLFALLVIMTLGPITAVRAQWSKGFHKTVNGSGNVKREGGRDFDVRRVRMDLEGSKAFTMTVYGARDTIALTGRWSFADKDQPRVEIDRCDGKDADIDGKMEFSTQDGRLEHIKVSGKIRGKDFSLDFRGDKDSGSGSDRTPNKDRNDNRNNRDNNNYDKADFDRLNNPISGTGRLNIGNEGRDVKSTRIALQSDGSAKLTLSLDGGGEQTMEGRWTGGGDLINVDLTRGLQGRLDKARCTIRRRRNGDVESVDVFGNSGRSVVTFSFRPL